MFKPKDFLGPVPPVQETRSRAQRAMILAGIVMFASYPMFYYQYSRLAAPIFAKTPTLHWLQLVAMGNAIILFASALLSALVGFLYAERLGLPGFGHWQDLRVWLPIGVAAGLALTPVGYYGLDREFIKNVPELFPRSPAWALAWAFGSSISQEVVARFGLLTICLYLLRWRRFKGHPWPAVAAVSAFALFSTIVFTTRLELVGRVDPWRFVLSLALTFLFQWLYGEIYVRRGFLAAVSFHFGLSVKLIIYALVL